MTDPSGRWVMTQRWHHLLFAHWRCELDDLRRLIPEPLSIDTYDGSPWIGVIPFYMTGVRFRAAPPVPTAHAFAELNVRTYVTLDGRPGVWFFSLDCESILAVLGARVGVYLPYFRAAMSMTESNAAVTYTSRRWRIAGPPAEFAGRYQAVGTARPAAPDSLDHFLTERYCLYSARGNRIWRADIAHPRWELRDAAAQIDRNTMLEAAGVRTLPGEPTVHYAAFQDVRFWLPQRVR